MENGTNSLNLLLDEVDLFGVDEFTNNSAVNGPKKNNNLIDAPVPTICDNFGGWNGWSSSQPSSASNDVSTTNFFENWPEVPTVSVEHRVSARSSSVGSSSAFVNKRESNLRQVLQPTKENGFNGQNTGLNNWSKHDHFQPQSAAGRRLGSVPEPSVKSSVGGVYNLGGLPPRIERKSTKNGRSPGTPPENGSAKFVKNDHQDVHRSKENSFDFDGYTARFSADAENYANSFINEHAKKCDDEEEDEDDDDVFLRLYGTDAASRKPLVNKEPSSTTHSAGFGRKKRVRFFQNNSENNTSELMVGARPYSNPNSEKIATRIFSWKARLTIFGTILSVLLALSAVLILVIYGPWNGKRIGRKSIAIRAAEGGCSNLKVEYVGNSSFLDLHPTSAITSFSIEGIDRPPDTIVFGFGSIDVVPCYGHSFCRGGVAAVVSLTGQERWRYSTIGVVTGLNCRVDINGDSISDCVVSGTSGTLKLVNGKSGELLWTAGNGLAHAEFLTPQWTSDLNGDNIPELLATMILPIKQEVRLYVFDGRSGEPYNPKTPSVWTVTKARASTPAMLWRHGESLSDVVLSMDSADTVGGIYEWSLQSLVKHGDGRLLFGNGSIVSPPIFADISGDGFADMVFCTEEGDLMVFDGASRRMLWSLSVPDSECVSPLVIGIYNKDKIPDIAATFCFGAMPRYRYCDVIFVDGKTGAEVNGSTRVRSVFPTGTVGHSVRLENSGGDVFLIWRTTCGEQTSVNYQFLSNGNEPGDFRSLVGANLCWQLYGLEAKYQLVVAGDGFDVPVVIYDSGGASNIAGLSRFVSLLNQLYSTDDYSNKIIGLSMQLGFAGTVFISDDKTVANVIFPTFTALTPSYDAVFPDCSWRGNDISMEVAQQCKDQLDRLEQGRNRIPQKAAGHLIIHNIKLMCHCDTERKDCAKFLSHTAQPWLEYLGSRNDGRYFV